MTAPATDKDTFLRDRVLAAIDHIVNAQSSYEFRGYEEFGRVHLDYARDQLRAAMRGIDGDLTYDEEESYGDSSSEG